MPMNPYEFLRRRIASVPDRGGGFIGWRVRLVHIGRRDAAQPSIPQLAGPFEDRIGDRGDVAVNALQVPQNVEVEGAGLDGFGLARRDPLEMAGGHLPLEIADARLLFQKLACEANVAGHEEV